MKRFILCLLLFAISANAYAVDAIYQSPDYTASQLIKTGRGNLYALWFVTDGTNAVTLDVYDGTDDTGIALIPQETLTTSSGNLRTIINFENPVFFGTGLYIKVTTSGAVTYKAFTNTLRK